MDNIKENNRRISIILNGEEKMHDQLMKDKQAYEQLLEQEITAVNQDDKEGDDFQWLLPEDDLREVPTKVVDIGERRRDKEKLVAPFWNDGKSHESAKIPQTKRKKKRSLQINFKALPIGLIVVVLSAVIVGTSFGFMMLTIFTGDNHEIMSGANVDQVPPAKGSPVVLAERAIPTLAVQVVQGGAFSLVAKGHEIAQQLKDNGFAAALSNTTDPVHLYIGVGLDREQATVISEKYLVNSQEVYLKPYAVTANGAVETEEKQLFLKSGVELYQELTLLSVNGLANGGSLLTAETIAKLTATQQKFSALNEAFIESEQQHLLAIGFQGALANAYQQLQNYLATENETKLWQVQQYLLNSLIAYEELVKTISKG